VPLRDRHLGAVARSHRGRVGLDLAPAVLATRRSDGRALPQRHPRSSGGRDRVSVSHASGPCAWSAGA
jgi:hypothetical protein